MAGSSQYQKRVAIKENHHNTLAAAGNVDIDFFVRSRHPRFF